MRIGLVRHFKVKTDYPDNLTSEEYVEWLKNYDELGVNPIPVDVRDINWEKCYSSTLSRAYKTAKTIYDGHIIKSENIVEVDLKFKEDIKGLKSVVDWGELSTENWKKSTGLSGEDIEESRKRVSEFLDKLANECNKDDNILIVCHELIMMVLESELRKLGFEGEETLGAKNGELFILERQ